MAIDRWLFYGYSMPIDIYAPRYSKFSCTHAIINYFRQKIPNVSINCPNSPTKKDELGNHSSGITDSRHKMTSRTPLDIICCHFTYQVMAALYFLSVYPLINLYMQERYGTKSTKMRDKGVVFLSKMCYYL
jgi:hypothetical protein